MLKVITMNASVQCDHGGVITNQNSQSWVTVQGTPILVKRDPEGRTIKGCPNTNPLIGIVPCTATLTALEGYSGYVSVDGKKFCLETIMGLTTGTPPGTVKYTVFMPGQQFVRTDEGFTESEEQPGDDPGPRVVVQERQIRINEKVYFAYNRAQIRSQSYGLLREVASVIKQNPQIGSIEVQGHTDSDGDADYNQRLSERRARAVVNFLTRQGVSSSRLTAVGMGEGSPVDTNETSAGKANNRRVEFHIKG